MSNSSRMDANDERVPRFRPDIEWVYYADHGKWVARDPLSNAFFYFSQAEHQVSQWLDGKRSLAEIRSRLPKTQLEEGTPENWIRLLIAKWKKACLLQTTVASTSLHSQGTRSQKFALLKQLVLSPLAVRVPLFDPSRFQAVLWLPALLLFHPITMAVGCSLALVCSFLVLNRFLGNPERFLHQLQQMPVGMWLLIAGAFLVVKSLHELGHVLATVRWNAPCREFGFLFLFFTPCMYCDTTESWRLSSKWQRAGIAAAGLYVELWIAGLASLFWLNAIDGPEKTLAASIMVLCSVGTFFVNGNPCFKYDGYYILSDLWGVPNLSQQSGTALWQTFTGLLGGRSPKRIDFDKSVVLLASYSLIAAFYRLSVLILLTWVAWHFLVPRGLGLLALLILATTALGIIALIARFFDNLMAEFFARKPIQVGRVLILSVILVGAGYFAFSIPITTTVRSQGILDFHDKSPLYAPQTSVILESIESDVAVRKDEPILKLDSPEKQLELLQLTGEIAVLTKRYELLKKTSVSEASSAFEIPTVLEQLKEAQARLSVLQPELQSLQIAAPFDGYFLPSGTVSQPTLTPPIDVRLWKDVSHPSNLGCVVERGTLLGWFTTKKSVSFQTLVPESEMRSLRIGSTAQCLLDSNTDEVFEGHVSRISSEPVEELSREFASSGWVIAERNEKGKLRPVLPHYQVTVEMDAEISSEIKGAHATIQFRVASQTIAESLTRYVRMRFK